MIDQKRSQLPQIMGVHDSDLNFLFPLTLISLSLSLSHFSLSLSLSLSDSIPQQIQQMYDMLQAPSFRSSFPTQEDKQCKENWDDHFVNCLF